MITANAQDISFIKEKNGYYHFFDSNGRDFRQIDSSGTEIAGYSSKLFIIKKRTYYIIYNSDGKKISTVDSTSVGTIVKVLSDGFVSEKNGYIYRWNSTGTSCKIINGARA